MIEVRRAAERFQGGDPAAGIDTRHAFSFGQFYDPDHLRFGAVTACNEERLAPGAGFALHRHRDLEIVSWVLEGELTHEDADGRATVIRPGDVQRLTAGSGVLHAERNAGRAPLRFLQTWLVPARPGGEPEYEVVRQLSRPYLLPGSGAELHVRRLGAGERIRLPDAPLVYAHVARGGVRLGSYTLAEGDAARLTAAGPLAAEAITQTNAEAGGGTGGGAELLLFVLPG
ncbi:pirin family protein [Streptomyces sp. 7-21]|jgi:redox-sensitive bicupin YhaK (pirin superfamily)|uniref:pirin family protein n=1 Tax=Streptomyces sp. 7-21 TaxID=2802283 RepID=UPI00191E8B76|nr:pirin family protein [Streptomyces sp. 7-21]MBL1067640.1 pirin family protein [Streptomyces sp. 7-21]